MLSSCRNWLWLLFGKSSSSDIQTRSRPKSRSSLKLQTLEDRITPSSFISLSPSAPTAEALEPNGNVVALYSSGLWEFTQASNGTAGWTQITKSIPISFEVDQSSSATTAGNVVASFGQGLFEYTQASNGTPGWTKLTPAVPTSFQIDNSSDAAFTAGNVVAVFSSGLFEYTQQGNTDNGKGDGIAGWTKLTNGVPISYTIDTSPDANFTQGNIVASFANGLWEYTQIANTNGGAGFGTPYWTILNQSVPISFKIDESGSVFSQGNIVALFANGLWEYQEEEIPPDYNLGTNNDIPLGWYQLTGLKPMEYQIDDSGGGLNTAGNVVASFRGEGLFEYTQPGNTNGGAGDGTVSWTKLTTAVPTSFQVIASSSSGDAAPGAIVAQYSTGLFEYNPAIPSNFFTGGNSAYSAGWTELSSMQTTSYQVDALGDVWAAYKVGGLVEYSQDLANATYSYTKQQWLTSTPTKLDVSIANSVGYVFINKTGLYEYLS